MNEIIYYIRKAGTQQILKKVKDDNGKYWARLSKGEPIGVIVSHGANSIGWSLVRPNETFNRKIGLTIARGREVNGTKDKPPEYIKSFLNMMLERSRKANFS